MVPTSLSIEHKFRGAHLIVTGATGFVGKVWLVMLLDRLPSIGRLSLLIRPRRGCSAEDRFWRAVDVSPAFQPLRNKHGAGLREFLRARVEVVEVALGSPRRGLSAAELNVCRTADGVVHFAGLTDFQPDPLQALAANVRGALHAAALAEETHQRRLTYISTAFVAGSATGEVAETLQPGQSPAGVPFSPTEEQRLLEGLCTSLGSRTDRTDAVAARARSLGWPNIYTYTKGLAEHLLAQRELRLSIVRPTVVESALQYPIPGWNEGVNTSGPLVWLLSSWFRRLPSQPSHNFDVVPVDTVARGVTTVVAALLDGHEGVFHLGSSMTNPLTFERAIDLTALAARRMHSDSGAAPIDRWIVRYLDAVPQTSGPDSFPRFETLRWGSRRVRSLLRAANLENRLPPEAYLRFGAALDGRIRRWTRSLRKAERTLTGIEDMLESYRPFIHDHNYTFRTDGIAALDGTLSGEERDAFGFDIADLCWRRYWLDVHVPGLERWCLPTLRGDKSEGPRRNRAERRPGRAGREAAPPKTSMPDSPAPRTAFPLGGTW